MSAYLGNAGGVPLMHFHRDEKTPAELIGDPSAGTVFHSDLPYVLIKKRFTLTSYSTWAGGRSFTLSPSLKNYRIANPDLAYLLILKDSSGRRWVHDPLLNVCGFWYGYNKPVASYSAVTSLNGPDYQVAYTASTTELSSLTRNSLYPSLALTFRTWDSSDTVVTVFRSPHRNTQTSKIIPADYGVPNTCAYFISSSLIAPANLSSSGNDVVSVEFVFLNMLHSTSGFDRQIGLDNSGIDILPDRFRVGSVLLDEMTPLISHGNVGTNGSVSPVLGGFTVSGKKLGVNMVSAKMSGNTVSATAAVLEIPPDPGALSGWDIDFAQQSIKRNGGTVFDPSVALKSLFVLGVKEISFNPSISVTPSNFDVLISSSQSGSFTGAASASVFLCSVVSGGSKLHSCSVFGVGDNMLACFILGWEQSGYRDERPKLAWAGDLYIYARISASGSVQIRAKFNQGRFYNSTLKHYLNGWINLSSVALTLPSFTIRLVGLGTLS